MSIFEGQDALFKALKATEEGIRKRALAATKRATLKIAGRAKEILVEKGHVKTGNLLRSIKCEAEFIDTFVIQGHVGTAVSYAPCVEALPDGGFLWPAVMEKGDEVAAELQKELQEMFK